MKKRNVPFIIVIVSVVLSLYGNMVYAKGLRTGLKESENAFMMKLNSAESLKDFESLIKDYSAEYAETIPKIEAAILNHVKTKGVGDRLVIKIKRPNEIHGGVSFTFSKNRYAFEFPGDGLPMGFSQYEGEPGSLAAQRSLQEAQDRVIMRLYGDDNINRFDGEVKLYEYYPFFDGYTFIGEGDKFHRLTFAIIKGVGYVYLRGKGSIISKNGEVIRLGYDDK